MSHYYVRNVCHRTQYYLTKYFNSTSDSKEISINATPLCSNACSDATDSEIYGFHKITKIQVSRERDIIFYANKKIINYTIRSTLWQKIVL